MHKITKLFICITILSIPFYLVRFHIFSLPTNIFELLAILTFCTIFLNKQRSSLRQLFKNNPLLSMGLFLLLVGISISTITNGTPSASLGIIKSWFLIPMFFSLLVTTLPQKYDVRKLILQSLYVSILLVSTVSFLYSILHIVTYDGRLRAFYLSPNHLAMYLVPGLFIGTYLAIKALGNKKGLTFLLLLFSLIFISYILYLTKSYAGWISAAMAYPILFFSSRSGLFRYVGRLGILMFIFGFILSTQISTDKFLAAAHISERSSVASRIMIWKSAIKIGVDNPLWGIGPGLFQEKYLEYQKYFSPYLEWAVPQPHNLYFAFWLQAGFLGLLGFMLIITAAFYKIKRMQKNKKTALLAAMLSCYFISILIWGIADTPYWKNDLAFSFWLILAMIL